MRRLVFVVVLFAYNVCFSQLLEKDSISKLPKERYPRFESTSNTTDSLRLKQIVNFLCTGESRVYQRINRLNYLAEWIKQNLEPYADTTYLQAYKASNGQTYYNVIALFHPENKERVVVGAHYDSCGDLPGADDNASGVAGIMEIARLMKGKSLNYCLEIVAYCLEEPPFYATESMGSLVHAKSLKAAKVEVKGMVSVEMIGYFSDQEKSQKYPLKFLRWFYGDKANYIALVNKMSPGSFGRKMKNSLKEKSLIEVKSISAPKSIQGIDYSDHRSYWSEGYDACMLTNTSFFRNANYHKKSDTPETLNYQKMAQVVEGLNNVLLTGF